MSSGVWKLRNKVIKTLKKGEMPYYEPGIAKLIQKNIKKNKLKFTTSYKQEVKDTNIFFICLGTPENKDGSSNLAFVFDVAKQLSENIKKKGVDCSIDKLQIKDKEMYRIKTISYESFSDAEKILEILQSNKVGGIIKKNNNL